MNTIPAVFANSSPEIQILIRDRPDYWEFILTSLLLDDILLRGRDKLACLDEGIATTPCEYLSDLEKCMEHAVVMMEDFKRLTGSIDPVLKRLMLEWRSSGEASDPVRIHDACALFASIVEGLVKWETQCRSLRYPDKYKTLFAPLDGLALSLFNAIEAFPCKLRDIVETSKRNPDVRKFSLEIEYAPQVEWDHALRAVNEVVDAYERKTKRRNGLFGSLFS